MIQLNISTPQGDTGTVEIKPNGRRARYPFTAKVHIKSIRGSTHHIEMGADSLGEARGRVVGLMMLHGLQLDESREGTA